MRKKNNPKKQIRELRQQIKRAESDYEFQCRRANNYRDKCDILKVVAIFAFLIGFVFVIIMDGLFMNIYYNPTIDEVCRQNFGSAYITYNNNFGPDNAIYCQYNQSLIPEPYIPEIRKIGEQNDIL